MRRHRPGFSTFELLVIVALLGFVFGFLMVGLGKARQAAKRIESVNNLRQIGIALHTYHDTNNAFPPGNDKNNYSTFVYLLPYIEQNNIAQAIDRTKPVTDKANDKMRATAIKLFVSPRDPVLTVKEGVAPTNYVFCAGSMKTLKGNNGVFCQDSAATLIQITKGNGTSNTMAVAETLKGDGGTKAVDVRRQHVRIKLDSLKPPAPVKVDPQRLRQLIADLDSNDFAVREKATEELTKLGTASEPALRQALTAKPSAEVKERINTLLARMTADGAINRLTDEAGVQDWKDGKNIVGDRCGSWMDGRFLQTTFTATRSPDDSRPDVDCEGQGGLSALRSADGRTIAVLFCDAHVQSIPTTVAPKIWKLMANWKNEEAFQLP